MQPLSSNKVWKGEIEKSTLTLQVQFSQSKKVGCFCCYFCIYGRIPFKRQTQMPIQETQILGTSALFFNMFVAVSEIYKM